MAGFLCSVIKQISKDSIAVPRSVENLYAKHHMQGNGIALRPEILIESLISVICDSSSTFLVLDAVDELGESGIYCLFDILERLSNSCGPKLRCFCTSRPTQMITEEVYD